jgi:hypothetical protein
MPNWTDKLLMEHKLLMEQLPLMPNTPKVGHEKLA